MIYQHYYLLIMRENIPKKYILIHEHILAHIRTLTYELATQNAKQGILCWRPIFAFSFNKHYLLSINIRPLFRETVHGNSIEGCIWAAACNTTFTTTRYRCVFFLNFRHNCMGLHGRIEMPPRYDVTSGQVAKSGIFEYSLRCVM